MMARASGFGMRVGRFSRPPRGVGVLARLEAGLDTTRRVESLCEVPLGAGELGQVVPGGTVGEIIDRCCAADGVISATRE